MTADQKKARARHHLAGLAIEYILERGDPSVLLRGTRFRQQYEILIKALAEAGWPEGAGIVQAYLDENGAELSTMGCDFALRRT